jgi:outer membrane biogenesis lipoprotein LolB
MRAALVAVLLVLVATTSTVAREPQRPAEEARARMEHHLREVSQLAEHFQSVMQRDCPQFASPVEWRLYLDGEIDRVVLLVAHLEQAWIEAKHTGDDAVRRAAKAPRKRVDEARALVDKLTGCAEGNGAALSAMEVWRRVERAVPRRQTEIALPSD